MTGKPKQARGAEKKARIQEAAIRVFAHKGYHGCRVSDIAEEAGIAYGLVYHYYQSKEAVLLNIFEEKWAVFVQILQSVAEDNSTDLKQKLSSMVNFLFSLYTQNPELAEVVILELIHSQEFRRPELLEKFQWAFTVLQRMFSEARERGEVPAETNTFVAPLLLLGNLETLLTGLALKLVPPDDDSIKAVSAEICRLYSTP